MTSSLTELAEVHMPQMGVSVAEGTITAWRKRPGDWVERDEVIVEISTDKVETEVPSPAAGRVAELLVEEGVTVDVGTLLATIDTGSKPGQAHADESTPEPEPNGNGSGKSPPVSPVVRRIADEHSIDLSAVEGSGRRGRVTKKDLLAFIEAGGGQAGCSGRCTPSRPTRRSPCLLRHPRLPATASSSASCGARSASTWCARCTRQRTARRSWKRT